MARVLLDLLPGRPKKKPCSVARWLVALLLFALCVCFLAFNLVVQRVGMGAEGGGLHQRL